MSTTLKTRTDDVDAPEAPPPAPRETPPPGAPAPPAGGRRRWLRPLLFLLLPVALVAGGYAYVTGGSVMSTENAYVHADMVGVSTDVSGIVKEIAVRENQTVAVGDVLFRLDDAPFRFALARAEAQIGIVTNDLNALKASYRDMQAQIGQAQVDVDYYIRDVERQRQLAARSVASEVTLEQSQRNLQSSRQKVASLTQQLAGIVANLAGNPDIAIEQHPRYVDAVAQRDEAARQLSHTVVRASIAGVVTNVPSLQPGQYLAAATPAFNLVATDHVWIDANPKETELTNVQPGQTVSVTVDTYPGATWHGTVDSIAPASAGSFALLPAQNTSGNWVKVVQRIPMRVRIETPAGLPQLRSGMSVVVSVDTGRPRGVPLFLQGLFGGGHD
ncbi:MAG TPA: HlyD family secretion protein [Roseomonas sp.]|jgi:membrane fusion protein (multidrug efflux system)